MTYSSPALPVSVPRFRKLLSEFEDSSVYLDDHISPWLAIAGRLMIRGTWGPMYEMGVCLFTAHQLALQRAAELSARRGGSPGVGLGIVNSKTVGGASIGYDTSVSLLKNGGDWNLTIYGIRFLGFARMFGSGGIQIVGSDAARVSESNLLSGTLNQSFLGL